MLFQLHQINPDGNRKFIAQREYPGDPPVELLSDWAIRIKAEHALLEGANWSMCTEKSPNFFLMIRKGDLPGQKHFEFDET